MNIFHARQDYNQRIIDTAGKIDTNEPVFLILGRDPAGEKAIEAWCKEMERLGSQEMADHVRKFNEKYIKPYPKKELSDCDKSLFIDFDDVDKAKKAVEEGKAKSVVREVNKIELAKKFKIQQKMGNKDSSLETANKAMAERHKEHMRGMKGGVAPLDSNKVNHTGRIIKKGKKDGLSFNR